jgi:hypothetical protein
VTQTSVSVTAAGPPLTVLGEVRTGLVSHHGTLTREQTERLLAPLALGEPVLSWERPIAHSSSAATVTGLDCQLALSADGARRVRAVGTAVSRASITGGTILQCSTLATVRPAAVQRRLDWSHYTARPGLLETISAQDPSPQQLEAGFLAEDVPREGCADFGSICDRLARKVQNSPLLEGAAPLLFQWTRLRWAATVRRDGSTGPAVANLRLGDELGRTLSLAVNASSVVEVAEFCGDLALHDWILTTVIRRMERLTADGSEVDVRELSPVVSRLLHLWMPAARVNPELSELWTEFEQKPGFTRQWNSLVSRMRDQISLHTALQRGVLINHDS